MPAEDVKRGEKHKVVVEVTGPLSKADLKKFHVALRKAVQGVGRGKARITEIRRQRKSF